jgi:molybdopterin converting factor small subunit
MLSKWFKRSFVLVKVAHLGNGVKEYCFERAPKLDLVLKKAEVRRSDAKSIAVNGAPAVKGSNPQLKHGDVIVIVPKVSGGA